MMPCPRMSTPIIARLSLYNIHISIYPLLSPLITPITLINLSVLITPYKPLKFRVCVHPPVAPIITCLATKTV